MDPGKQSHVNSRYHAYIQCSSLIDGSGSWGDGQIYQYSGGGLWLCQAGVYVYLMQDCVAKHLIKKN